MSDKKYRNEDWLREKIHKEGLLLSEVADEANVTPGTITRWRKKHNIKARSSEETQRLLVDERLRDEEWMEQKYLKEQKDITEISKICSVGRGTVFRWLNRHEINTRVRGENQFVDYELLNDYEFLYEQYVDKNRTLKEISEKANCSPTIVSEYLQKYDIEVDHPGSIYGERNCNYKHGNHQQNRFYGENWDNVREEIIKRDNEQCQSCAMIRKRCREKYNTDLSVHHIIPRENYRKDDGTIDFDEANKQENLITLCSKCHTFFERKDICSENYKEFSKKVKQEGDWPERLIGEENVNFYKI